MADLKLYIGYPGVSSWSLRGWLAARKSGLAFEHEYVDYRNEAGKAHLKATSPTGKVPLLVHNRAGGDLMIWESLAVCEYLAELAPEAGLWPDAADARAVARAVSAEMHAGFFPMRRTLDMALLETLTAEIDEQVEANVKRISELWTMCRRDWAEVSEGPYLFGRFTIADAMYAPVATRFRTYGIQLDGEAAAYQAAILSDPDMKVWEDMAREFPTP